MNMSKLVSVLKKCGASDAFVKKLLDKGLYISSEIQRYSKPLHPSHAHDALYELEEQIPKFTDEERKRYIEEPYRFYLDATHAAELYAWIIGELINIVPKVQRLKKPEERISASLALIRIFFASYDFNILKYDRDIEYHEFEESVTGYFWQKGIKLCDLVFPGGGEEKLTEISTGTMFLYDTMRYYLAIGALREKLKSEASVGLEKENELLKKLSTTDRSLYDEICWVARQFYKYPQDVVRDSNKQAGVSLDILIPPRIRAQKMFMHIYRKLLEKDVRLAEDFNDLMRAIDIFMRTNERIDFIVWGRTPQGNGYVINDSLPKLFEIIKDTIRSHPKVVKTTKAQILETTLQKTDEMKIIGTTPGIKYFLTSFEKYHFFSDDVDSLYNYEIRRWTREES